MKNNDVELAVIIPVYNEDEIIETVLGEWTRELDGLGIGYELHVYNDGSKDNTLTRIRNFALHNSRVLVHDKPNSGHGATILQGYRENADKGWIFQVDSDNEMSPGFFPVLWSRRNEYDLLIGRRGSGNRPISRVVISFISRVVVWVFYGTGVHYVNSPYRLMRSSKFREYFQIIPPLTIAPNLILSGIACLKQFRIYEGLVAYRYRTTGESSVDIVKILKMAVRSFFETARFRFVFKFR